MALQMFIKHFVSDFDGQNDVEFFDDQVRMLAHLSANL